MSTKKEAKHVLQSLDSSGSDPLSRLKFENENLKELIRVSREIGKLDLADCLRMIIESVVRITGAERGFVMLYDQDKNLSVEAAVGIGDDVRGELEISRTIATEVAHSGRGELIENVPLDSRYRNATSVVALNLKAVMCVPLSLRDEVIGIIYVDSDRSVHNFSMIDLELFEAFAAQASIVVDNARLFESLRRENQYLKKEVRGSYKFDNLVYQSARMEKVCSLINQVLDNRVTVIVCGETGTGKEQIARAIHYNGKRKTRRFVTQNCGALTDSLLESELFGHRKGSFTGAVEHKQGLFEFADGGTVFLDEIGDTSAALQVRLFARPGRWGDPACRRNCGSQDRRACYYGDQS